MALLQRAMHFRMIAVISFAGQVPLSDCLYCSGDGGLSLLGARLGQCDAERHSWQLVHAWRADGLPVGRVELRVPDQG